MRAGGPRLVSGSPASADLREQASSAFGRFIFDSQLETKIFVGAWFYLKEVSGSQADILCQLSAEGVLSPLICIRNDKLTAAIHFTNVFIPVDVEWKNRWIYLGVATHLKNGSVADLKYYYKYPGQPMQNFANLNDANIGISNLGQMFAGTRTFGTGLKGRLGAPSVYTFSNPDFSDIAYPQELIEPTTNFTWYCDPLNGNDSADGTTPAKAWKTAEKLNIEGQFTGMFAADSYEQGNVLIIDTGGEELDLQGTSFRISTPGLNVKAAEGQEWIRIKAQRTLPNNSWSPTATSKVFSTADTQDHVVLWEDDKFMHHPTGATFESVKDQLASTPGSFWTDGSTLYVHPFGSTDPRIDGKKYERSYYYADGGAMILSAPNLHIEDIHLGKTCLARSTDNDPIGGYCVGFGAPPGRTVYKHSYLYYGSKHNLSIVQGGPGDDVLIEDVQCEQGSPYAGAGGQTVFVSFNHQPLDLGITHRFHRCRSVANAGVIGSTEGVMTQFYPVFYSHNLGTPNEPDQFELFEFIDCDFGIGNIQGDGVKTVYLERTRCGSLDMHAAVIAHESYFHGMNRVIFGRSLTERNCIHLIEGSLRVNPVAGNVDLQGCTIDARGVVDLHGGVPQAALFTRQNQLELTFVNNLVLMPFNVSGANVFANLRQTDQLTLSTNAYQLGTSNLVYQYFNGSTSANRSHAQWQSLGFDSGSFLATNLQLDLLRPTLGSPLINAGANIGPLKDYTGGTFKKRNDIGAFESPPVTFEDWQTENFTEDELQNPAISGPGSSYLNDGNSNLLKYAFGHSAITVLPQPFEYALVPGLDEFPPVFEITYERSRWNSDISLTVETSIDLVDWSDADIDEQQILSQTFSSQFIKTYAWSPSGDIGFVKITVKKTSSPD